MTLAYAGYFRKRVLWRVVICFEHESLRGLPLISAPTPRPSVADASATRRTQSWTFVVVYVMVR